MFLVESMHRDGVKVCTRRVFRRRVALEMAFINIVYRFAYEERNPSDLVHLLPRVYFTLFGVKLWRIV